jgi:hypothetical protein
MSDTVLRHTQCNFHVCFRHGVITTSYSTLSALTDRTCHTIVKQPHLFLKISHISYTFNLHYIPSPLNHTPFSPFPSLCFPFFSFAPNLRLVFTRIISSSALGAATTKAPAVQPRISYAWQWRKSSATTKLGVVHTQRS